jgi:hypothetical protein
MLKMRVRNSRVGLHYCLSAAVLTLPFFILLLGKTAAAPKPAKNAAKASAYFHSASNKSKKSSKLSKNHQNPVNLTKPVPAPAPPPLLGGCNFAPMHSNLSSSSNPVLRKLAEYEQVCGGSVASRVMLFTNLPGTIAEAQAAGADFSGVLNEFAKFNVQPLVIMEPTTNQGTVNFHDYSIGAFDPILDAYYKSLKAHGISDNSMGMWVYFPEADIPNWGATDPSVFAANVTRSIQLQKKTFPASKSSVLLDAMSYPAGSTGWDNGQYVSLSPYVSGIPKGLVDSFGLQGFPWVPPANVKSTPNLNPATFLNSAIATEAAKSLGTTNIWLNSGTFSVSYANSPSQKVIMSPEQRQTILNGIAGQALSLQKAGFKTAVNLFSQNKSNTEEAIDWSYWSSGTISQSIYKNVFINFASQLHNNGNELWLFDSN